MTWETSTEPVTDERIAEAAAWIRSLPPRPIAIVSRALAEALGEAP